MDMGCGFERLITPDIKSYIASGIRKEDVSVRFKYAEIQPFKVEGDVQSAIIDLVNRSGQVCYILVNYTALFNTQDILKKLQKNGQWKAS